MLRAIDGSSSISKTRMRSPQLLFLLKQRSVSKSSRGSLFGLAERITPAPDGLDVILAVGRGGELLAQFADEYVDDLEFRLVHPAIEVVHERFLRQGAAPSQGEQLDDLILLASQRYRCAAHRDRLGIEVDDQTSGGDDGFGVALRSPYYRVDASDELGLMERLGDVVVGAGAERLDLGVNGHVAGEDQYGRVDLRPAQRLQNRQAVRLGRVAIEDDDVIVFGLGEVDRLFTDISRVGVEPSSLEDKLDVPNCRGVAFDEKNAHVIPPIG